MKKTKKNNLRVNSKEEKVVVEYTNSFVAFVDVMGFKNLLENTQENRTTIGSYFELANLITWFDEAISLDNLNTIVISDSIFYTLPVDNDYDKNVERFEIFVNTIASLQYEMAATLSIWTRGSISIGEVFVDQEKNLYVGQGFVNAIELEKDADYARVILDPKVFRVFNDHKHNTLEKLNLAPLIYENQPPPPRLDYHNGILNS